MPVDPDADRAMIDRVAARVLLVDRDDCLLLFRGCDPAKPERGTWWFTPGGGLDHGESLSEGARRELREETGLVIDDLGSVVYERTLEFEFEGDRYHQTEHFFFVRTDRFDLDARGWTEEERRSMLEHRWWTRAAISAGDETIYPEVLADLLDEVLERA